MIKCARRNIMKRFRYVLPKKFKIAAWIVLAVWTVMIFFTLSRLFNLFGLKPSSLWLEYTTLVLSVLLVVFMIAALNVSYAADASKIRLRILFFDVLGGKILTQNVRQIVLDKKSNRLFILSKRESEQPVVTQINISPESFGAFSDRLKELNKNIIYTESD